MPCASSILEDFPCKEITLLLKQASIENPILPDGGGRRLRLLPVGSFPGLRRLEETAIRGTCGL